MWPETPFSWSRISGSNRNQLRILLALFTPRSLVFMAFFLLPLARLAIDSAVGPSGSRHLSHCALHRPRATSSTLVYTILLVAPASPW